MEADAEKENNESEVQEVTVDLSKQSLKKIERASNGQTAATNLILDENELQRLDNIDSYANLTKLSIAKNHLIRMYGISNLTNLTNLDLSHNSLLAIEGVKDLKHLTHLNLSRNKIKTIDHLNNNLELEYLNLSENDIMHISDISCLQNLKELFLHNNRISHLRQCEKNLPVNLETLTLSNNSIMDLNEVSHLVQLILLKELSLKNNPCLEVTGRTGFNYRPYVKNWCSSIIVLDGYPLDDIECLKAEWLYSQGRGRSFRPGEHAALIEYLSTVCPSTAERNLESEDERKLRLILSKAQQHQQQLREQLTTGGIPLPIRNKLPLNKKKAAGLTERMVSSYHDSVSKDSSRNSPDLMTRSLDATILRNSPPLQTNMSDLMCHSPLQTATTLVPVPESLTSPDVCRPLHPLLTAVTQRAHPLTITTPSSNRSSSRNSPFSTPESKRRSTNVLKRQNFNSSPVPVRKSGVTSSPKLTRSTTGSAVASPKRMTPLSGRAETIRKAHSNDKETSEEEDSEMSASKLQAIQQRASQKRHKKHVLDNRHADKNNDEKENFEKKNKKNEKESKDSDIWKAALCIQRRWRGYRTRNLNSEVVAAYKDIQTTRIQDYIIKVASDMEATRVALEGNRKLQVLQMQAINALWKKMATLQPNDGAGTSNESKDTLQGLAETCLSLNKQVEELQCMMKVMQHIGPCDSVPIATQTEIVAVHTPQGEAKENFPYHPRLERPSNLPITQSAPEPVEQFVTSLVSDVMKTVSSTGSGADSCSDPNEVILELDDNSNLREPSPREESVCLTPACQEGKDLQSSHLVGSQSDSPKKSRSNSHSSTSRMTIGAESTHCGDDEEEGERESEFDPSQLKDSSRDLYTAEYKNGCPSF